jgi:hypothetical protein
MRAKSGEGLAVLSEVVRTNVDRLTLHFEREGQAVIVDLLVLPGTPAEAGQGLLNGLERSAARHIRDLATE